MEPDDRTQPASRIATSPPFLIQSRIRSPRHRGLSTAKAAVVSSVAESPSTLAVATRTDQSVVVLTVDGALDTTNSAALRDHILQATLEGPPRSSSTSPASRC